MGPIFTKGNGVEKLILSEWLLKHEPLGLIHLPSELFPNLTGHPNYLGTSIKNKQDPKPFNGL